MNLLDVLRTFAQEVPDFLTTSIVSRQDGTSIGSISVSPEIDPEAADAYFADMLNKNDVALGALGVQDHTEDVLTTTRNACFVTRVLGRSPYFWHVATGRGGSIGLTRALMRKYEVAVLEKLP